MSSTTGRNTPTNKMNANNLYREEIFTDLIVGAVQRMTPVESDGSTDNSREPVFFAQTHIMWERGPQPIHSRIEAKTLEEAVEKFQEAIDQTLEKARPEGMP